LVLTYAATIPLSTRSRAYLSGPLAAHRQEIGSPWRRLDPGEQALLALAHLRNGDTYARLAAAAPSLAAATRTASRRPDRYAAPRWDR
jgi:hypothetical protein